jgi:hypothetical protein
MVKTAWSIIISIAILVLGGVAEQFYLEKTFDELHGDFVMAYQKIDDETATPNDVLAIKTKWLSKKQFLHYFISHNDIKEMDLWISETVAYLKLGNFEEAISKMDVAISLCEQIPKNYLIRFENIF